MTEREKTDRLATFLKAAAHGKPADNLAETLEEKFGSVRRALERDIEPLRLCGLSESGALLLHTLPAVARRCALEPFGPAPDLNGHEARRAFIRALYTGVTREKLYLLCLDGRQTLIDRRLVGEGSDAALSLQPRLLVREALNTGAKGAILCHNHPGGRAAFSAADRRATREVSETLAAIGVTLLDHMLCADGKVISLRREDPAGRGAFVN